MPKFRAPKWRVVRAIVFGIIFLSGAVPMTHAVRKFGYEQAAKQMGWWWLILEASLYVTGALIYAASFFLFSPPPFILTSLAIFVLSSEVPSLG